MEVTITSMQNAGRGGALDTGRHAFGGPDAGRTECFSFFCSYFLWRTGGKGTRKPHKEAMVACGLQWVTPVGDGIFGGVFVKAADASPPAEPLPWPSM